MKREQYELFLSVGAWICAVAGVLNLFHLKRRGNLAFLLTLAFLSLGATLLALKSETGAVYAPYLGCLVAIFLIADFALRARQQERPR